MINLGYEAEFSTWEMPFSVEQSLTSSLWRKTFDGSVSGAGIEIALSRPQRPAEFVNTLKALYEQKQYFGTNTTCGNHFHVSLEWDKIKNPTRLKKTISNNLLILGNMFENSFFECLPLSRQDSSYCQKLSILLTKGATNPNKPKTTRQMIGRFSGHKYSNPMRYCWINFVELFRPFGIRTVEFRALGNTTRLPYIYSVLNLYLMLFKHSITLNLPDDVSSFVNAKTEIEQSIDTIKTYQTAVVTPSTIPDTTAFLYLCGEIQNIVQPLTKATTTTTTAQEVA